MRSNRLLIAVAAALLFSATGALAQEDVQPPPDDQYQPGDSSQPADDDATQASGASGYQYDDLGETGAELPPGFEAGVTAMARRWCGEGGSLTLTRLDNLGGGGAVNLPRQGWMGEVQWRIRAPTWGDMSIINGRGGGDDVSFGLSGNALQVRRGSDFAYLDPC